MCFFDIYLYIFVRSSITYYYSAIHTIWAICPRNNLKSSNLILESALAIVVDFLESRRDKVAIYLSDTAHLASAFKLQPSNLT